MKDQTKSIIKILFFALMGTRFVFAFLVYGEFGWQPQPTEDPTARSVLVGVAIILAVVSYIFYSKPYDQKFMSHRITKGSDKNPDIKKDLPDEVKEWSEQEIQRWRGYQHFFIISVIAWALSEMIAVLGMVYRALGGTVQEAMFFIMGSIVLGFLHRPDFHRFEAQVLKKL